MKVLLVEDNRGDARLFVELVAEVPARPFQVTTVGTLAEAKQQVAAHDIVFLDLSLPDAHGISTVVDMVAADPSRPIVVLTGNDDDTVAVEAMKQGAQDFLRKGEITPALIARTARYAVERKAAQENLRQLATAEETTRRAKFVSSVTAAATSSFELQASLGEVARLVVPVLADCVVIDVVRGDGRVERMAHAASTVEHEAILAELAYRYVPGEQDPKSPVLTVLAERRTLLQPDVDWQALAPTSDYASGIAKLGLVSLLVTPLVARGRVVGAISYSLGSSGRRHDDDHRLLAEELAERIALGIDNARLYHHAQRAISGRDELLAVVSHDLRNPLGVVGLALQMLADDPDSLASAVPRAQRAVDRMVRLIDDLLDVARIDSGTLSVDARPVELGPMLDDVFEQHRVLATEKRIELVRGYNALGTVMMDRHRIGQALSNLLGNALKMTPAGGQIGIEAERTADHLVIAVRDSGPGIAPEHRTRLFDRFWQPEQRRDGVGLGLAIVKGIVDAHGGTIEVDSILGAGATFKIVLPPTGSDRPRPRATAG